MFTIAVKDHVMIAHSLRGAAFGPAQQLHGATYVITTEYQTAALNGDGVVIDIGVAHEVLATVLAPLNYRNLDDVAELSGVNTTTEALAHHIHQRIADRLHGTFAGTLRVVLEESHVAWGAYEGGIGDNVSGPS